MARHRTRWPHHKTIRTGALLRFTLKLVPRRKGSLGVFYVNAHQHGSGSTAVVRYCARRLDQRRSPGMGLIEPVTNRSPARHPAFTGRVPTRARCAGGRAVVEHWRSPDSSTRDTRSDHPVESPPTRHARRIQVLRASSRRIISTVRLSAKSATQLTLLAIAAVVALFPPGDSRSSATTRAGCIRSCRPTSRRSPIDRRSRSSTSRSSSSSLIAIGIWIWSIRLARKKQAIAIAVARIGRDADAARGRLSLVSRRVGTELRAAAARVDAAFDASRITPRSGARAGGVRDRSRRTRRTRPDTPRVFPRFTTRRSR